jgi:hypothetical protein
MRYAVYIALAEDVRCYIKTEFKQYHSLYMQYEETIQGEHKITLHFQNYTENKFSVLRTLHLHQSIEKLSKFCTHLIETRYVQRELHGRCQDDNPARPKLCAECPQ